MKPASYRDAFSSAYRGAVREIVPFLTPDRLAAMARHNPGWRPGCFEPAKYLETSEVRYATALEMFQRHARPSRERVRFLDIGGFLGAFPLALSRLGMQVTIAEKYGYYYGAFDDLRDYLVSQGAQVWDLDLSEPLELPSAERFDLIAAMAILEHLPSSPRAMLQNARTLLTPAGRLVVDVPNIAYWPKRIGLLLGRSPLPPIADIYDSEPPFTGHHHEYTADELLEVLTRSDLKVDEVATLNYTPWPEDGVLRRLIADWPRKHFASMREVVLACAARANSATGT